MILKGSQIKRLRDALIGSFSLSEFDDLLLFELEQRREQITTASGLNNIVKEIILKADEEGWVIKLAIAAAKERKNDIRLEQLSEELAVTLPANQNGMVDPYLAWRLLGDQLLVNRSKLRNTIQTQLNNALGKPILVIDGPRLSGKTHSIKFINHLQSALRNFEIVWIDLEVLALEQRLQPEDIAQSIVTQMGLEDMPRRQNEQASTWGRRFCEWLGRQIADGDKTYWILIDHCGKVLLPQGTRDLLIQLSLQLPIKLKPHRLILLGYSNDDTQQTHWETLPPMVKSFAVHETIQNLDDTELITFFKTLYQEHHQKLNQAFTEQDIAKTEDDIAKSVTAVLSTRKAAPEPVLATEQLQMQERFWQALRQEVDLVLAS